jgi:hypothetical protein
MDHCAATLASLRRQSRSCVARGTRCADCATWCPISPMLGVHVYACVDIPRAMIDVALPPRLRLSSRCSTTPGRCATTPAGCLRRTRFVPCCQSTCCRCRVTDGDACRVTMPTGLYPRRGCRGHLRRRESTHSQLLRRSCCAATRCVALQSTCRRRAALHHRGVWIVGSFGEQAVTGACRHRVRPVSVRCSDNCPATSCARPAFALAPQYRRDCGCCRAVAARSCDRCWASFARRTHTTCGA